MTQGELESRIKVALGGTLAEELTFDEISNGATSDLNQANMIARRMVKEFGMSRLGRIYLRDGEAAGFLPGLMDGRGDCSEETAREVEMEVRSIIDRSTVEVRGLLEHGRSALIAVAERLIEKEVIDGPELLELLKSHDFPPTPRAERHLLTPARSTSENGFAHPAPDPPEGM
jgi:cell division protease FtsH